MVPSRLDRAKYRQESPTFWLMVMAGSLALHLVVLLVGRWYIARTTVTVSGGSPTPIEFVEIDPNAPVPAQPLSVGATASAAPPQAAPPPGDTSSAPPSSTIAQLPPSPSPSPVAPSPEPPAPVRPDPPRTPSPPRSVPPGSEAPVTKPSQPSPSPAPSPSNDASSNPNSKRPTNPTAVPPRGATSPSASPSTSPSVKPVEGTDPTGGNPGGEQSGPAKGEPIPNAPPSGFTVASRITGVSAPGGGSDIEVVDYNQPEVEYISNLADFEGLRSLDLILKIAINTETGEAFLIDDTNRGDKVIDGISPTSPTLQAHPKLDQLALKNLLDTILPQIRFKMRRVRDSGGSPPEYLDRNLSLRINLTPKTTAP